MEIWKDIPGYEGLYQVSNEGRALSIYYKRSGMTQVLVPGLSKQNYLTVSLAKSKKQLTKPIHRCVAEAFLENLDNKKCVNHKDGNKLNNNVENLEWCTYTENAIHAIKTGLRITKHGYENRRAKPVLQYDKTGVYIKMFPSSKFAQQYYGFHGSHIISCCKGIRKTCGGFIWKYL